MNNSKIPLLTNISFSFFPISFIIGNFAINLNLIVFCFLGLFILKSKIIKTKFDFVIKLIFFLFFLVFFSTLLSLIKSVYFNEYELVYLERLCKALVFFRFFIMLVIIYLLNKYDILNFKYFFVSSACSTILISLDLIFQYIFGFNFIGMKTYSTYRVVVNTGFFGDEFIAGGFVQNFSIFSIFFIGFLFQNKKKLNFLITTVVICLLGVSILVAGNRMPLILFLFGLFLIFISNVKLYKTLPISISILIITFMTIGSYDQRIKNNYSAVYGNSKNILGIIFKSIVSGKSEKITNEEEFVPIESPHGAVYNVVTGFHRQGHLKLFFTAIDTWEQNKIFGNGIKSFRIDCAKFLGVKKDRLCSNHPHNYYLEILTETGVVGLTISLVLAGMFLFFIYKNFKFLSGNKLNNFILVSAVVSLILELFPLKSSGSIFTTNDMAYIILLSSIILSYKKLKKIE